MDTQPAVDLIVLNWNAKTYLDACLRSLAAQEYPHARIILVDNASSDDSVAFVRTHFPDVEVIASAVNRGFSGGNNLGLAHSRADIAVLVNPDVEAPPGWLTALIAPMLADARIGIAGSLLCDADGAIQHAGGLVKPPIGLTEHVGRGSREVHAYAAVADVDYVIGAAMAIRREVVARIGGLDETFFLYYEDVDYCARARHAGFRVVYAPTPPVVHHESATTGKESQFYLEQLHTSRWRYLVKHTPADTLTGETVAAERAWTATRSLREQRAFVRAYRRVLQELPRLWTARVSRESSMDAQGQTDPTGREQMDRGQMDTVAAELAALVDAAAGAQTDSFRRATAELGQERQHAQAQTLEQLQRASYVVEQPLTSQAPVIGPLLAWFRNLWNNVATTWYVRPLLQQQNDYNALVYAKLEEMAAFQRETYAMIRETHALLAGMNERMIDDDRDVTELARQVGALEAVLVQWERRMDVAPSTDRPPGTDPAA
jgi:GT2 family glycosyltransferase